MNTVIFPAGFASQGALNEDYSVGLDGARPVPTPASHPPFRECTHAAAQGTLPKSIFASMSEWMFASIKEITQRNLTNLVPISPTFY